MMLTDNNPHKKFFNHLIAGGKIFRDDKLNRIQEVIDINTLKGNAMNIIYYGYKDLTILCEVEDETIIRQG